MRRDGVSMTRRLVIAAAAVALLSFPAYSWMAMAREPSSLPMSIRTIEWIRDNSGGWFVDAVENVWFTVTAPLPGGPGPLWMPRVGASAVPASLQRSGTSGLPERIAPVIGSGLPDEGVWKATTGSTSTPSLLVTTFRPDSAYPRQVAYVAWIDASRTQIALYPGRREPPNAVPRGPMKVPVAERKRLLATFNSGFKYKDCKGGFVADGVIYKPLVKGQGTLLAYADGRVDVVDWQGGSLGPDILVARQNCPLIVDNGRSNARLDRINLWGTMTRVWRSAVGVDARGNLIYVAAPGQTASTLAKALIHVGAVRAIQLDIHSIWPSFNTYARPGASGASDLVPNTQQKATRYLSPDDRDFFAVYLRQSAQDMAALNR